MSYTFIPQELQPIAQFLKEITPFLAVATSLITIYLFISQRKLLSPLQELLEE